MANEIDWDAFVNKTAGQIRDMLVEGLSKAAVLAEDASVELESAAEKLARYLALAQANPEDVRALRLLEHAKADCKMIVAIYSVEKKQNFRATAEKVVELIARTGLALLVGLVAGVRVPLDR